MTKIIIVDDDQGLANLVRQSLVHEKYEVEVAYDGAEARVKLRDANCDLIILDWQLPDASGIALLEEYRRARGTAPVLMLTGMDKVEDKEIGLDSGADDYLTKPFSVKELTARVRALLRRPTEVVSNDLHVGSFILDRKLQRVKVNGSSVKLLPKEFQLIEFLMRHPNHVFSAEELLNRVWSSESESTLEALKSTFKRLRRKVDPDGKQIRTVHGVGFVFDAEGSG
jgi:DNA-binding response OmpR family regulator